MYGCCCTNNTKWMTPLRTHEHYLANKKTYWSKTEDDKWISTSALISFMTRISNKTIRYGKIFSYCFPNSYWPFTTTMPKSFTVSGSNAYTVTMRSTTEPTSIGVINGIYDSYIVYPDPNASRLYFICLNPNSDYPVGYTFINASNFLSMISFTDASSYINISIAKCSWYENSSACDVLKIYGPSINKSILGDRITALFRLHRNTSIKTMSFELVDIIANIALDSYLYVYSTTQLPYLITNPSVSFSKSSSTLIINMANIPLSDKINYTYISGAWYRKIEASKNYPQREMSIPSVPSFFTSSSNVIILNLSVLFTGVRYNDIGMYYAGFRSLIHMVIARSSDNSQWRMLLIPFYLQGDRNASFIGGSINGDLKNIDILSLLNKKDNSMAFQNLYSNERSAAMIFDKGCVFFRPSNNSTSQYINGIDASQLLFPSVITYNDINVVKITRRDHMIRINNIGTLYVNEQRFEPYDAQKGTRISFGKRRTEVLNSMNKFITIVERKNRMTNISPYWSRLTAMFDSICLLNTYIVSAEPGISIPANYYRLFNDGGLVDTVIENCFDNKAFNNATFIRPFSITYSTQDDMRFSFAIAMEELKDNPQLTLVYVCNISPNEIKIDVYSNQNKPMFSD